ncbi:Bifunctional adenosylcobalamin biosynthesis protein CobP [Halomicronema hongdechloris C2206]|uniref:Adenosylcobinamide kinase n=1 Tax=Halomicronema hongdechloris C2206 TaxID=1641165 RepID=A0A1Z3HTL3_9CYAN|nr:bifunctional adenosylcobinamide kinase/adenosylcobinamide-phosphate guanylyltransferase [Halomicronema hongdechloris]ASC73634.1 Bifunctional adenosylcobalamin biosynthesis protein CobP [Halomicronema hongdechloris C2206]
MAATLLTIPADACVLVDSLGTWLTNLVDLPEAEWRQRQTQFLQSLAQATCQVILVAEETGWGVVPAYPLGRTFCDRMGRLTRQVGQLADPVYLVVAGPCHRSAHLGANRPPRVADNLKLSKHLTAARTSQAQQR